MGDEMGKALDAIGEVGTKKNKQDRDEKYPLREGVVGGVQVEEFVMGGGVKATSTTSRLEGFSPLPV